MSRVYPSSSTPSAGTNARRTTGRRVGKSEEASECLQLTLGVGGERAFGFLPGHRQSSPPAPWATGTCLMLTWLVLAGRNGGPRSSRMTETPQKFKIKGWGGELGELLNVLAQGSRRVKISGFMILWSSLFFLLSSPLMYLWLVERGKEEKGVIWMQQVPTLLFLLGPIPITGSPSSLGK